MIRAHDRIEMLLPGAELSKRDAEALGVADMTGPQLRARVLELEGALAALLCEVRTELDESHASESRWKLHREFLRSCYEHAARVIRRPYENTALLRKAEGGQ